MPLSGVFRRKPFRVWTARRPRSPIGAGRTAPVVRPERPPITSAWAAVISIRISLRDGLHRAESAGARRWICCIQRSRSFLRYCTTAPGGDTNPIAGTISKAITQGASQSGAFIHGLIFYGFNEDGRRSAPADVDTCPSSFPLRLVYSMQNATVSAPIVSSRSSLLRCHPAQRCFS